ncbi:hypothetical protein PUN28_009573 [Cardiocondyla obscurior]|uniref:Uncharacterized protein n=1 Tax=Cardiocondyla obscurior TaxID=286306 RepID=A0AAW2FYI3_9HYME
MERNSQSPRQLNCSVQQVKGTGNSCSLGMTRNISQIIPNQTDRVTIANFILAISETCCLFATYYMTSAYHFSYTPAHPRAYYLHSNTFRLLLRNILHRILYSALVISRKMVR